MFFPFPEKYMQYVIFRNALNYQASFMKVCVI